jgi:hypothetical protein
MEEAAGVDPPRPASVAVENTHGRSINILCLCGLILGIAAVFSTWTYYSEGDYTSTTYLITILPPTVLIAGASLFVLGTILAILTPLAGLVQVAGLVGFLAPTMDRAALWSEHSGGSVEFGPSVGFYVGVLSAVLVLASLIHPMGPGFGRSRTTLRRRFFVYTSGKHRRKREWVYHGPRMKHKRAREWKISLSPLRAALSRHRKWVAMLVSFMLVSLFIGLYENDFLAEEQPLEQVRGGVFLELFPEDVLAGSNYWEAFHLSASQGDSGTGWTFQNSGLDGGVWSVLDLGKRSLGPLNLSLTIIDRQGNGVASPGDKLVITAQDATVFADDTVYSLYWRTNRTIAWTGWEVSFEFHDGCLDSWISEQVRYGL